MRLKISTLAGSTALALVLSGCGGSSSDLERPEPGRRPVSTQSPDRLPDEIVRIGEPYEIAGKKYEPRDDVTYDETGYAGTGGDWAGGPGMVAVVHRTLPVPSYVEITHLETGKTILARVVDRGPNSNDRVLDMSPAAAEALGVIGGGTTAIRVRRVNPPEAEKAALRLGKAAPTRLDTPPALLSALRRRLNEKGQVAKVDPDGDGMDDAPKVAAKPAAKPTPKPVAKKAPAARVVKHTGADFDGSGVASLPPTAPVSRPAGKFVVEGAGAAPVDEAAPAPAPRPAKPARVSASAAGPFFIQIGSFADRSYAEALAAKAEAQVYDGGSVWRVRLGPFPTRADAEQALGPVQGNGYPQARISR